MKVGIEKSSNKIVLLLLPVILLITLSTTVSGLPVFQEVKMTPNKAVVGKNITLEFVVNVTDDTGANITNVWVENVPTVGKLSLTYNSTTGKWEGNVTIDTATIAPNVYTLTIYAENETKYVTTKTVNLTIFDFEVSAGVSKLVLGGETTITVSTTPQVKGVEVYLSVNRTEDTIDGASDVTKTTDENGEVKATLKVGANLKTITNPYQGKVTADISGVTKEFVYTVDKLHLDIKLNETVLTKGSGTVAEVIIENPTEQAVKDALINYFNIMTPDGLTSTIAYMEKLAVINAGATVKPYVVTYEVQGREVYFYVKDYQGNVVKEYGPFAIGITPGNMTFTVQLVYHLSDPTRKSEDDYEWAEIINLASTNITKVVAEITNFTIIDPNGNEYKDKPYIAYPWDKIRYNLTLRNPSTLGDITYHVEVIDPVNYWNGDVLVPKNSSVNLTFEIKGLSAGNYSIVAKVSCGDAKVKIVQEFVVVTPYATFEIKNVNTSESGHFINAVRGNTIQVTYKVVNPGKYTLGDDPNEPSANLLLRITTPEGKVIQLDQGMLLIPKGVTTYNKFYAIPTTAELGVYNIETGFNVGGPAGVLNVVLVIDVSGSMCGQKLYDAKKAAKVFVDQIGPNDRVAIVAFSDYPWLVQDFTSDKALLKSKIDSLYCGGATALYDAIGLAVDILKGQTGRKAIIALTDGMSNNDYRFDLYSVTNYAKSEGIPVYTVGLGPYVEEYALRYIANETGGKYYYAPTSAELAGIYSELGVALIVGNYDSFKVDVDEVRVSDLNITPNVALRDTVVKVSFNVTRVGPEFNNEFKNNITFAPAAVVDDKDIVPVWVKIVNVVNNTAEIDVLWKPVWYSATLNNVTFNTPLPPIVKPGAVLYMNIIQGTNVVESVSKPITLKPNEIKRVEVYVSSDDLGVHSVRVYVDVFLTNTRGDIYPYSVGQYVHGDDYLYGTFTTVMAPKIVITDVAVPKLVDPYYYPYKYIVVGIGCEFYANVTLKNVGGLSGSDVLEVYVTDLSGNVTYYHDASNVSLQPYELKTVQVKVKAPDQEGTFVVIFRTNNSEYRLIMYTRSIEITGLRILDSNLNETDAFHHGDVMVIEVNATNYGCLQASKNVTVGMTLMLYVPKKPTTPFAYYGLYYYPMYIPIMTKSFEIKLSGKESESYRIAFKIPDDLPNGNYIVGVWPEEYPNYDMIIGCPYYADKAIIGYGELKIINMTLTPTTISPGQFVMANVTIKNVGELKAWGTLKLIEEGPTIKTIQPKKIEAMNSGDVKTVTVTIFNTAEKGTYKVTPVIESYGSAKPIYVSPGPNLQLETEPMSDDIVVGIIGPGPNNVLETTPVNDDRAIKFNLSLEFDLVIIAGPNGILESNVSGDDYIIPTSIGDIIVPGANKVLDTIPSGDDAIVHIGVDIPDITVQFIVPGPNGILETRPNGDDVIHGAILPGKNLVLDTTKAKGDDVVIEAEEVFKVNYGKPGIFKTEIPKPSVWMKPIQPKICDNVTIFAEFMNPGIVPMNILAKLVVTKPNGEMLNFSKIVMVPANGTKVVSFTFHVDMGGNWSYNFNGVIGAFYVVKPASLTIVDIVQPDKVPQNWTMKISVIIGNEGDLAGNDTLILKIIEAKTKTELYNESRIVSVLPHGTVVENFTYTPTKKGTYITHAELVKFAKYKDKRFTVIEAAPVFEVKVSPIEQTVGVKENATFTVIVKNVGTKNATNVTLTVLNANWSQVAPAKVDVLAINQSAKFTVTVKMDVAGDYKLMFNVTCDEGVSTFGTATLHVLKVFKKKYLGHVGLDKEVNIDTIPAGAKNVFIQLKTEKGRDTDLRLYDNNTMVVGFGGIIDSDTKITSTYKGDVIEYSGWAGGNEYIKIDSTSRPYIVKVYGFEEADYEVTIKYYYS